MNRITYQKKAALAGSFDVAVCGGGVAGFAAAVSAARAGLKTALIERFSFIGGTATGGLVVPVSGFFFQEQRVVGGIGWELMERLMAKDAALAEMPKGHISVQVEEMKLEMQRMLLESGVALFTNCYLTDCRIEDDRISHVIFESKSGSEAIAAKTFIDATGDGDLCAKAGVPMLPQTEECQPMSLCFLMNGIDLTTDLMKNCIHHNGIDSPHSCNKEIEAFLLSQSDRVRQFGGPWFNTLLSGDCVAVNVTRSGGDATDRAALTAVELKLREDMFRIVALLKERYPEFKEAQILSSAVSVGIRESRHIEGLGMAIGSEMLLGTEYDCPVARCAHPMDIHSAATSAQSLTRLTGKAFVPHTALIPKGIANLLAAGRCICADRPAFATLRVQATLMSIGEAAGLMAKLCCGGTAAQALDPKQLSYEIEQRGFVLK